MLATAPASSFDSSETDSGPPWQLYRRFFTAAECAALDAIEAETALSEINLIRLLLGRVLASARRAPQKKPATLARQALILTAVSQAALIIASLVRFHEKYFGWASQGDPALAALAEMDPNDL
jgi:hypothetical protein